MSNELRNHLRQYYRICSSTGHLLVARTGKRFRQRLLKPFNQRFYKEACLIYCFYTGFLPEKVRFKNFNRGDLRLENLEPAQPKPSTKAKSGIPYIYQTGSAFHFRPPRETSSVYAGDSLEEALCHLLAWEESCKYPTTNLLSATAQAKSLLKLKPVFKKRPEPDTCQYCGHKIYSSVGKRLPRHCPSCGQRYWWLESERQFYPEDLHLTYIYTPDGYVFPRDVVDPNTFEILEPKEYKYWIRKRLRPLRAELSLPIELRHKVFPRSVFVWAFHHRAWPPIGKNIRFKDGNPDNTRIENLYVKEQ